MGAIPNPGGPFLTLISSTGVRIPTTSAGVVLTPGTYFASYGADNALVMSVQLQWGSTFVATITFEDSNNPDALINTTAAGQWTQQNPDTAYVGGNGAGGLTATGLTLSIAGGLAGSATVNIGNSAAARNRMQVVVTTGGLFIPSCHNKA